jgi:hypothetical protein
VPARLLHKHLVIASLAALALTLASLIVGSSDALAVSAPIHIDGTDGEGVFIRPDPSTANPAVGWMPEGASPDYNCFVWGQNIGGVPIWFNVNYGGKTGYYASYYDDSSYNSNEELTAKYGVPLCGASPSISNPAPPDPSPSPAPGPPPPPASTPPASPPSAASPQAIAFLPFKKGEFGGKFELNDGVTQPFFRNEWETYCETSRSQPARAYQVASTWANGRPIKTIAGWSLGRIGVISYLWNANKTQLEQLNYALLIDPGYWAQMTCDRLRDAGDAIVRWLRANPKAHLVVISSSEITQQENSRGIQESYFDAVRAAGGNLSSRILVCDYLLPNDGNEAGHDTAFWASRYWIQHEIGSTAGLTNNSCPQLSLNGSRWNASAGWHPTS